jgi:peptidoglycan hydrolase-like protein with peptidoglycan-binding domain
MDGVLAKGNGLIDVADKKLDETFKDVKDNVQSEWNKVTGLFDGDESPTKQAVNRTQEPASNGKTVVAGLSQVAQQFADMAKKTVDQKHEHHPQHATGAKSHANNGVFDKGARGDDVKHVQTMLASLGAKVAVDGIYSHETERAVKGYQMMNGLEADGIVGPKTMAALKEDAQRVPTQSAAAPVQVEPRYQGSPDKYVPQQTQAANAAQPELSNTAQGLIVDAKTHIQNWVAANGLQWNEQFHQAAHSIASAAHQQGFPGINMFAVNGGQIDFGHKEGFMLKTGSVETAVASNTDISKSLQAMADVDQKQSQTQSNTQQQTFAQNKEHSGVQRG